MRIKFPEVVVSTLLFCLACLQPSIAAADQSCANAPSLFSSGTLNFRLDNDLFGGAGQDQGYTNGFLASWVSPNLVSVADDSCLPGMVQGLNRYLRWLQPRGFDEHNITLGFGQMMYTPANPDPKGLMRNDRPYAGALMLSMGYNARSGNRLRTSQLRVGVIGPASRAGKTQKAFHRLFRLKQFQGWEHQLHNEPVIQYLHERRWRLADNRDASSRWGWDIIGHAGVSLGNFATYANAGMEFRFGYLLPDDFGTAPLRPAGENTSPVKVVSRDGWAGHLFVAFDGRGVARDITLDGNTFRSSHSVRRRPFVADLGYGIALTRNKWHLTIGRYHRSREFYGQKDSPIYGAITIGRRF